MRGGSDSLRHLAARAIVLLSLTLGLVLTACAKEREPRTRTTTTKTVATPLPRGIDPDATVVLRAGPRQVTLAELARVMGPPPQQRLRISESERRHEFLRGFERTELLALAAEQRGYFRDPALAALRKRALVDHMIADLFGPRGTQIAQVTATDVRAYYDENTERWGTPEQMRARHILVRDLKTAERLIVSLRGAPDDTDLFVTLARRHSADVRTRDRGGDLGRFARHAPAAAGDADGVTAASMIPPVVPEPVRAAAFALPHPGALVQTPIESELGYHVLQLLGRYPAARTPLAQITHVLGEQLQKERTTAALEAFTAALVARASVRVNEAALARVRVAP